ncbi:hypothetical protein PUN28_020709 [Cardiocondyla obscurior]|uniref:Uncharacterized protein n=1 Tax=Cardiocondyla obscurior TaxID=286306 RepID=A0AAW2E7P3_9HYME
MPHRPSTAETPCQRGHCPAGGTFLYAKKAPQRPVLRLDRATILLLGRRGPMPFHQRPPKGEKAAGGSQPPVMPPSPHQLYSRRRRKTLTHKGSYWATPTPTAQVLRVLKDREAKEPLCLEVLKRTSKIATQQIALKRAISPA